MPTPSKLRKSAKSYWTMVKKLKKKGTRSPEHLEALKYLRALYDEFGRRTVRQEIEKFHDKDVTTEARGSGESDGKSNSHAV